MVEVEEIDEEGKPLRYEEEMYHKKGPTIGERITKLGQIERERDGVSSESCHIPFLLSDACVSVFVLEWMILIG